MKNFSPSLCLVALILSRSVCAQSDAWLVKDVNTTGESSYPSNLLDVNGVVYFTATTSAGNELWKSDGTAAGTVMVKDIYPGPNSSNPGYFYAVNNILYFGATDGVNGSELWRSDGTAAGTYMVKDIYPGSNSGHNSIEKASIGSTLLFAANDPTYGTELWKSDGTAAGTVLVKDISPAGHSYPGKFSVINGVLYFYANDNVNGYELWRSDGTTAGTYMIKDINPGAANSTPQGFVSMGGFVYFSATHASYGVELWRTDGTAAGTTLVSDLIPGTGSGSPGNIVVIGTTLYCAAYTTSTGMELVKSDGTAAGTVLVKDIYPGTQNSTPNNFVAYNGAVYFSASDVNGAELWKTDGTAAGTVLVKDIYPGAFPASPGFLTVFNSKLYFKAADSSGAELWQTDGTRNGTTMVKDVWPGTGSASVNWMVLSNGKLVFSAADGTVGSELWKSDGTAAGTVLIKDIHPATADSNPNYLVDVNGTVFFSALNPATGTELWKSDGTAAGTVLVKDIHPGNNPSNPINLVKANNILMFTANDGVYGSELWRSDGTANGTYMVSDLVAGASGSSPSGLVSIGGTVYFVASSPTYGGELWKSDGTYAGTVLVKDIWPGATSSSIQQLVVMNGIVYFSCTDGVNGFELWRSDGSAVGTYLLKDIYPGSSGSSPSHFAVSGNTLYFRATDAVNGQELWKTDGTPAGTVLVKDIVPGTGSSSPSTMFGAGGKVYFNALEAATGYELWCSDGTAAGTLLLKDINPGSPSSYPSNYVYHNGIVYFAATSAANGTELWRTDGTPAGTYMVKDFIPGSVSGGAVPFVCNGTLFVTASDPVLGIELFVSNGTDAGTTLVKDINPGLASSSPSGFIESNGTLFFTASDGVTGRELWKASGNVNAIPTVAVPAAASPNPVTGMTTTLTVLGADDGGEGNLIYTWYPSLGIPAPITLGGTNGTNAGKSCPVTFTQLGTYDFTVEIRDAEFASVQSYVTVNVVQTATTATVTPASVRLNPGQTQQFTAVIKDQFGTAFTPGITWSVSGGGTINSSGLFTAGSTSGGPYTVTASSGASSGASSVTINAAPVITTNAIATPSPVTGTTTTLSVAATDDAGEATLTYTWATTGTPPAPVIFASSNGTNVGKSCLATFSKPGTYAFQVTVRDGGNLIVPGTVTVSVLQTAAGVTVSPAGATINPAQTQQYTAAVVDQFGASANLAVTWNVSGGGTINTSGLFTAGSVPGGPHTVTATSAGITGTTTLRVNSAPTFATAASANPSPVNGTTTTLSALGNDDGGEAALTYTWATSGTPPAAVLFNTTNGTNAAKSCVATFIKGGAYTLIVTIKDANNLTATSSVNVTVNSLLTSISITPVIQFVNPTQTLQFTASPKDQFGLAFATVTTWSVTGGGTISSTGLFTAGATPGGPFTVQATSGAVTGTTTVNVNAAPTIFAAASAFPSPVTGNTTTLSVIGADDAGEPSLTYSWATTGTPPAPVVFNAVNGANSGKNCQVTFAKAGLYNFIVTIKDSNNLIVTSSVNVTVNQTLTTITASPSSVFVNPATTTSFTALCKDQFGISFSTQPAITWTVSGGGTINASGVFSAGAAAGGPFTVTASASAVSGTAMVYVNAAPTVATSASASPNPVTAKQTTVTVLGADDGGEPALKYTWAGTGVSFSPNGTNAARTSTATFTNAGNYSITVTIADALNRTVTSTVSVTVNQTLTTMTVLPASVTLNLNKNATFTVSQLDQFSKQMSQAVTWAVSGGGAISSSGVFTAGALPGGPHTVTANVGALTRTATVSIVNAPPTVVSLPKSIVDPVTTTSTILSVRGEDDGFETNLIYSWQLVSPAPAGVAFSLNSTNSAKDTTVTFSAPGTYKFNVTIQDALGLTVSSSVTVSVLQTIGTPSISPPNASVYVSAKQQYNATALDQFGRNISSMPTVIWAVSGGGTIDGRGLFIAGNLPGTYSIVADIGGTIVSTPVTVVTNTAPVIVTAASCTPSPVTGKTAVLSVLGNDTGGEANLIYTWSATGPAAVSFVSNGTNTARQTTAVFSKAGTYTLTVKIADSGDLSVNSSVTVVVNSTLSTIDVSPASTTVKTGTTRQFTAIANDQFDTALTTLPIFNWTVTGGAISAGGLFTATSVGGPFTVKATSGAVTGQAIVSVSNNPPPTIATPASANPNPVTGNTTTLSVLGADDSPESSLLYTWDVQAGPAAVSFSDNGTNAAKNSIATFNAPGLYTLRLTARDTGSLTATSSIDVVVLQTAKTITITPQIATISGGSSQAYSATVTDQFNAAITPPPQIVWTANCGGWIENTSANTARFNAGKQATTGIVITAATGGLSATATATVSNSAPAISVAANAIQATSTSVNLTVTGSDDAGEAGLTYTWRAIAPSAAAVIFSENSCNNAKNTIATLAKAGEYKFEVTVADAGELSVTSVATVTVNSVVSTITVSPTPVTVVVGSTALFTAKATDQFSNAITSLSWTASGGGTISPSGVFTATTPGSFTVKATYGTTTSNSATVTVQATPTNTPPTVALTSPANNYFSANGVVSLTATASDSDGIKYVEFFYNGLKIGDDESAPYTFTWYAPGGTHLVSAKATDNKGVTTASAEVSVRVNHRPSVVFNNPLAETNVEAGTTLTIQVTATDADGSISSVKFYKDSTVLGTVTTGNAGVYTYAWKVTAGVSSIKVDVTDNSGAVSTVSIPISTSKYSVMPLKIPGGFAVGVNNAMQVACYDTAGSYIWQNGVKTSLGSLGGKTQAYAINAGGVISGYSQVNGVNHGFYHNGTIRDTGSINNSLKATTASAINDQGYVAGESVSTDSNTYAFISMNGVCTPLSTVNKSRAYGINNNLTVVGVNNTSGGAFVWKSSTGMLGLPSLGGTTFASDINNIEQIVGMSNGHAVMWQPAGAVYSLTDLGQYVDGTYFFGTQPCAINDSGEIIAKAIDDRGLVDTTYIPLYIKNGVISKMSDLISDGSCSSVLGIANNGVIAGTGELDDNVYGAALFIPNSTIRGKWISPAGNSFTSPTTIPLEVTASDSVHNVSKVEFFTLNNGVRTLIGTATTSPYRISWSPPVGVSTLQARVYNQLLGFRTIGGQTITVNSPPTITTPTAARNTNTTASLSVLGADNGGEASLAYAWNLENGPAPVVFTPTSGAGKSVVAAFSQPGLYIFRVVVTDAGGLNVTGTVSYTVNQEATSLTVGPSNLKLALGDKQKFYALIKDQFGSTISPPPTVLWAVNNTSTIAADGTVTAGNSSSTTVTASCGAITGTVTFDFLPLSANNVRVTPATASVSSGGSIQFTSQIYDSNGNATTGTTTWSVSGGGTISASGLFSAAPGASGPFAVIGTLTNGTSGSAQVWVGTAAPTFEPVQDRAPGIRLTAPSKGQIYKKTQQLVVSGIISNDDGSKNVEVKVFVGTATTPVATFAAPSSGSFSMPLNLPDGYHSLKATASELDYNNSSITLTGTSQTVQFWVDTTTPDSMINLYPNDFNDHYSSAQIWGVTSTSFPNSYTSPGWFMGTINDTGTGTATIAMDLNGFVPSPGGSINWYAPANWPTTATVIQNVSRFDFQTERRATHKATDFALNTLSGSTQVFWTPIILTAANNGNNGNIAVQKGDSILVGITSAGGMSTWTAENPILDAGAMTSGTGSGFGSGTKQGSATVKFDRVTDPVYQLALLTYEKAGKDLLLQFDMYSAGGVSVKNGSNFGPDCYARVTCFDVNMTAITPNGVKLDATQKLNPDATGMMIYTDTSDDDGDGILNKAETSITPTSANLAKIVIRRPQVGSQVLTTGIVSISVQAPGALKGFGNAQLWYDPSSTGEPSPTAALLPVNGKAFDLSSIDPLDGKTVYLQGLSPSIAAGDVAVVLEFNPLSTGETYSWNKICRDLILVTVGGNSLKMTVDANHDGVINNDDYPLCEQSQHGVVMAKGFGLSNHPSTNSIKMKIDCVAPSETLTFSSDPPGVTVAGSPFFLPNSFSSEVNVTFPCDGVFNIKMSLVRKKGDAPIESTLKVAFLSNGLGAPDDLTASTDIVPGFAFANLISGNLYFGAVATEYVTPAMGPGIVVSYNHQDGLLTGLGLGWRTNYDMRVFDGSYDANGDGLVDETERCDFDPLITVDETGTRHVFFYSKTDQKFIADGRSGLAGATLDPNPSSGSVPGARYRLNRNDNRFFYYNLSGHLIRIQDLRGQNLFVQRGANDAALMVEDDYGRREDLSRYTFENPAQEFSNPLFNLSGRQMANWTLGYDNTLPRRINRIRVDGDFSHSSGQITYDLTYNGTSISQVKVLPSNPVYTKTISPTQVNEITGGATNFVMNPTANAWKQRTTSGVVTNRSLDARSRRLVRTQTGRYSENMVYDAKGNQVLNAISSGTTRAVEYGTFGIPDANLLKKSTLIGAGGSTTYDYYTSGKTTGLIKSVIDPKSFSSTYEYNTGGFLSKYTDTRQKIWLTTDLNAYGQPLRVVTPESRVLQRTYTTTGLLESETDFLNYRTSYMFDSQGRLIHTDLPGGGCPTSKYDPLGRKTFSTDANGRPVTYSYDVLGRPTRIQQPGIGNTLFNYSALSGLVTVEAWRADTDGVAIRKLSIIEIDSLGRQVSESVPSVLSGTLETYCKTSYFYSSAEGWLDSIQNPRTFSTKFERDDSGRVIAVTSPEGGRTRTTYDSAGRVKTVTDPDNRTMTYEYDALGNTERTINAAGGWTRFSYDQMSNLIGVTPSVGNGEVFTYDNDGMSKTATDVFNKITTYNVNTALRQYSAERLGITQTTSLDPRGFATAVQTPLGTSKLLRRNDGVTSQIVAPNRGPSGQTLDSLDRLTARYSPVGANAVAYAPIDGYVTTSQSILGNATTYKVDVWDGSVLSSTDTIGGISNPVQTVTERDASGNIMKFVDASNLLWQQEFDRDNRLVWRKSPDDIETRYTYTPGGQLSTINVAGEVTRFEYDALGKQTKRVDATGRGEVAKFDELGVLKCTNRIGELPTQYVYHPLTRTLNTIQAPGGRNTTFERDDRGRVVRLIDPMGNVTVNEYDTLDRITKTTHADGKTELFEYYAIGGDLHYHTDRAKRKTEFSYDAAGRVTQKRFLDTGETAVSTYSVGNGMVRGESFNGSSVQWQFDKRGRLVSVTQDGAAVTFDYYNDDRPKTKNYAGQAYTYNYEPLTGRLQNITGTDGSMSLVYDNATGRVKGINLPHGLSRVFDRDAAGRITKITQNGEVENIGYDGVGRMETRSSSTGWAITYGYDAASRLATETRTLNNPYAKVYEYDLNDNRTKTTTTIAGIQEVRRQAYNSINQLTDVFLNADTVPIENYTYYDAGTLAKRTVKSGATTTTTNYGYDRLNRLTSMNVGAQTNNYTYYGASWMRKSSSSAGVTSTFTYDGHSCVTKSTGGTTTRYFTSGNEPLWETTGTQTLVYAKDAMGNVSGLWSGAYTNRFTYDAYGKVTQTDGAGNPITKTSGPRYRGEIYDAETDQVYLRNRYYSPDSGRFSAIDPKGMVDGPNMYQYCGGDPVNNTDPTGTVVVYGTGEDKRTLSTEDHYNEFVQKLGCLDVDQRNALHSMIKRKDRVWYASDDVVLRYYAQQESIRISEAVPGQIEIVAKLLEREARSMKKMAVDTALEIKDQYDTIQDVRNAALDTVISQFVGDTAAGDTLRDWMDVETVAASEQGKKRSAEVAALGRNQLWNGDQLAVSIENAGYDNVQRGVQVLTEGVGGRLAGKPLGSGASSAAGAPRRLPNPYRKMGSGAVPKPVSEIKPSIKVDTSGRIYEIKDGVRRSKAAHMNGKQTIRVQEFTADGKKLGPIKEVPIDNLRSPHKSSIDISDASKRGRWESVLNATKEGVELPVIEVRRGIRGTKIENITLDTVGDIEW